MEKQKPQWKSVLLTVFCALILLLAAYGIYRMADIVVWTARTKSYRQAIAASMDYAEQHSAMTVAINDGEPVKIHFSRVFSVHNYLVITAKSLPAGGSTPGRNHASIDCGDGSTLNVWDAGARRMRLQYRSPDGKTYRYTLQYHTPYDGWDKFVDLVNGVFTPA